MMGRPSLAERRARMMTRVANAAFTNHPGLFGRVAQRAMGKMAPPLDPELVAELYDGLEPGVGHPPGLPPDERGPT